MSSGHSKQPTGQRGIAKKAHIDVNTSTGGVHENCVDYDIVADASGRERMCPHCVL